jgi:hypothetical protein
MVATRWRIDRGWSDGLHHHCGDQQASKSASASWIPDNNRAFLYGCSVRQLPKPTLMFPDESGKQWSFNNLYETKIELMNFGNQDFATFSFGITLPQSKPAIFQSEPSTADRHHKLIRKTAVSPAVPVTDLDYEMTPFNREDRYAWSLYVTSNDNEPVSEGEVRFSSSAPIRFYRFLESTIDHRSGPQS